MTDRAWINETAERSFLFGPFRLLPRQRLLMQGEKAVALGSRAFEILLTLVESAGELVSKEALGARVWPTTFVSPANIAVHISALRRALGDGRGGNRYVLNSRGRGYRFVAPVTVVSARPSAPAAARPGDQNLWAPFMQPIGRAETIGELPQQPPGLLTTAGAGELGKINTSLAAVKKLIGFRDNGVWRVE
jgi:DNA-binding winged helix-turn-helix (wHTH) protein